MLVPREGPTGNEMSIFVFVSYFTHTHTPIKQYCYNCMWYILENREQEILRLMSTTTYGK
jgi:hypothetical protein